MWCRETGLWLYSDHHASTFAVKVDGSVIVEYRHADLVEGYYMMHDGTVLEKPAYPGVEITPRLDFAAVCAGAEKVGFCHAGKTGEFADVTEATKQRMDTISAELVDVTKDVDTLKSVHSDFEVEMQFHTGKMIEKVIYAFPSICRLGRLYKDIETDLAAMITRLGSPGQFLLGHIGLLDSDGNSIASENALPGRRAQNGNVICLLVEINGPSNANAAGGRLYSFGKPTESLRRLNAMCIAATNGAVNICTRNDLTIR